MPIRKKDTARALGLLEEYCTKLRRPEEQQLKTAILRVMGIFKSNLFEALLDIQEFYEVTLLNTHKSCEQKLEEVNHMADKWEKSVSVQNLELAHSACPVEEMSLKVERAVMGGLGGGLSAATPLLLQLQPWENVI